MSKNAQKKINKLVKTGLKDKIHEAATKLVTEEIQRREEKLKADIWKACRQRDICFIIDIVLGVASIALFLLWWFK